MADVVLRIVERFPDGTSRRNNLALQQRDGFAGRSLVHCSFNTLRAGTAFEILTPDVFEGLWQEAEDPPLP